MTTVQPGSAPHDTSAPSYPGLPPNAWIDGCAPPRTPDLPTDHTAEYLSALVLSKVKHVRVTREMLMEIIANSAGDNHSVVSEIVSLFVVADHPSGF